MTFLDNGEDCASSSGIDWDTLNNCASGQEGVNLMTSSISYTQAKNIRYIFDFVSSLCKCELHYVRK